MNRIESWFSGLLGDSDKSPYLRGIMKAQPDSIRQNLFLAPRSCLVSLDYRRWGWSRLRPSLVPLVRKVGLRTSLEW